MSGLTYKIQFEMNGDSPGIGSGPNQFEKHGCSSNYTIVIYREPVSCTPCPDPGLLFLYRLYMAGLVWGLGMKFAIEEINNSTKLLPGIRLGYDIYDTCMEPVVALQPSLLFLTKNGTGSIGVLCNYSDYQTQVTAVIGPHNSELCMVTAKLFGYFLIPQVTFGPSFSNVGGGRKDEVASLCCSYLTPFIIPPPPPPRPKRERRVVA